MKAPRFKELIIHEDDNVVIINKPPLISTLEDRADKEVNILAIAKKYNDSLQVCHRLDKGTSGALILAKNPDSYSTVCQLFEHRKINKTYHAIVDGLREFKNAKVDLPLLVTGNERVSVDKQKGKKALTFFNTIEIYRTFSLIECKPITGRMHQIRIHLNSQATFISADVKYGGSRPFLSDIKRNFNLKQGTDEQPMIKRMALHALSVEFQLNGKKICIEAPYPKDFEVFKKLLQKYDSCN